MPLNRLITFMLCLLLGLVGGVSCQAGQPPGAPAPSPIQLRVAAAASLTDVLQAVQTRYEASQSAIAIQYNFASSGTLQQQIEQGAAGDLFISAAAKQMDQLQAKGLIVPETRQDLLTNQLVLIVPKPAIAPVASLQDLTTSKATRIALGDPKSVPAGQYATAALTKLGLWEQIKPKTVFATNVRQVLQFVEAGNADAGIVYLTDAKQSQSVKIVEVISDTLHPPITYPIAVLSNSPNQEQAKTFIQFLLSRPAEQIFIQYGFTPNKA